MSAFVLDNSVSMRWLLESNKKSDQVYAESVLKSLIDSEALIPNLWHLEASNVLLGAEKRKEVGTGEVERFISQLENLPLRVDAFTYQKSLNRIMVLARSYKLSSYDAAYLELALREGLPLATLDREMIKAARKAGVDIYLT
jgi:predicted nucleic acid-binding protein